MYHLVTDRTAWLAAELVAAHLSLSTTQSYAMLRRLALVRQRPVIAVARELLNDAGTTIPASTVHG